LIAAPQLVDDREVHPQLLAIPQLDADNHRLDEHLHRLDIQPGDDLVDDLDHLRIVPDNHHVVHRVGVAPPGSPGHRGTGRREPTAGQASSPALTGGQAAAGQAPPHAAADSSHATADDPAGRPSEAPGTAGPCDPLGADRSPHDHPLGALEAGNDLDHLGGLDVVQVVDTDDLLALLTLQLQGLLQGVDKDQVPLSSGGQLVLPQQDVQGLLERHVLQLNGHLAGDRRRGEDADPGIAGQHLEDRLKVLVDDPKVDRGRRDLGAQIHPRLQAQGVRQG
jgi:hypothetical protein